MAEKIEVAEDAKSRDRSPSSPFISLKKAVERADALAKNFKKVPARLTVVAQTWGYAPKSSGLLQSAAALTQYGLVANSGSGEDRKIVLTDLAWKILTDARIGEKDKALREAALKPKLIAEYFSNWMDSRPVDDHCISELTLERGFSDVAAKAFLKVYDETISYANLSKDDTLSSNLIDQEDAPNSSHINDRVERSPVTQTVVQASRSKNIATFPLPEGTVILDFPEKLSAESCEDLRAWFEIMLKRASRAV